MRRRRISASPSPPGKGVSRDEKGEAHEGPPEADDLAEPGPPSTAEEPMEVEMIPQKRKEEKVTLPPKE